MGMRRRSIFENNALKALVSNSDVWGDDLLAALGRMFVPSMISINSRSFDSIGGGIGLYGSSLRRPGPHPFTWWPRTDVIAFIGIRHRRNSSCTYGVFSGLSFVPVSTWLMYLQPAPTTLSSENDFAVTAHCACGEVSERRPRKLCQVHFEPPRHRWLHRRSAAPRARRAPCASVRRARRIHPATGRVDRRSGRNRAIRRSFAR